MSKEQPGWRFKKVRNLDRQQESVSILFPLDWSGCERVGFNLWVVGLYADASNNRKFAKMRDMGRFGGLLYWTEITEEIYDIFVAKTGVVSDL